METWWKVRLRKKISTQTTSSSNKQDMSKKESDPVGFRLQQNRTKSVKTSSFVIVNKANINTQEQQRRNEVAASDMGRRNHWVQKSKPKIKSKKQIYRRKKKKSFQKLKRHRNCLKFTLVVAISSSSF